MDIENKALLGAVHDHSSASGVEKLVHKKRRVKQMCVEYERHQGPERERQRPRGLEKR